MKKEVVKGGDGMIKGCQREMIMMQTQDSTLFESAYFILRRQKVSPSKQDMVAEAHRIIGAGNSCLSTKRKRKHKLLLFALGFFCGALLAAFFILLLYT